MAVDKGESVISYRLMTKADARGREAEEFEERQRERSTSCLRVRESNFFGSAHLNFVIIECDWPA